VQVAGFAVTGALLALFVRWFRHELGTSRSGRIATVMLSTVAAAFVVAAFPTDRATAAADDPNT
jgi:hypothetical protein